MTAETKRRGVESGVFFESILSRCSHTLSTSGGGRETSLRGSLRIYLDCLMKEIERLSSSSTTFNTRFSWRLPRGLYPYVVKDCQSSSSTECIELELPMKILDDLTVCKVRAVLRARAPLQTGVTPAQACGKKTWSYLRKTLGSIVNDKISSAGGRVLLSYAEKDVVLTARHSDGTRTWSIVLKGRIDYATLVSLNRRLFVILFEVTEYKEAPHVVKHRLLAYASTLYGELGFPVVPVLLILEDQDRVKDLLIAESGVFVAGVELRRAVGRLVRVLSAGEEAGPAAGEVCAVCDPPVRSVCPYAR